MASEEEDIAVPGMRSFWSGTITFGLVNVPVALFPATRTRGVALRMVGRKGTPLQRRYVCSKDGKELSDGEIVRGYEVEKGKFVVVTDDELEAIEPRKSRDIDLQLFVPLDDIDPKFFERAYVLVPGGGTNKAYRLLAEVMETTGLAGIATFVMRAKEYLVAIIAEKGLLRAETLRFEDELRTPESVGLPEKGGAPAALVLKFERTIAQNSGKVNFRDFTDDYAERLEKLVERKQAHGGEIVTAPAEGPADAGGGEVIDLLEVLRNSLGGAQTGSRKSARKAPPQSAASKEPSRSAISKKRTTARKSGSSTRKRRG
jgi:DNA end-binding protein Ku